MTTSTADTSTVLSPAAFLAHWQGHRALTRRVIEAFPEDQLFTFSAAPPMRPFGEMAWELVGMGPYLLNALQTDDWTWPSHEADPRPQDPRTLLTAWDELTAPIDRQGPGLVFHNMLEEKDIPWGRQTGSSAALYIVDNEIHHRAQGYVYLRALGIEPPAFWER